MLHYQRSDTRSFTSSSKSSKEMEINTFLDEVHKKKVSYDIRQRNREKKHQAQESLPIQPEEKTSHNLNSAIQPCNRSHKRKGMNQPPLGIRYFIFYKL